MRHTRNYQCHWFCVGGFEPATTVFDYITNEYHKWNDSMWVCGVSGRRNIDSKVNLMKIYTCLEIPIYPESRGRLFTTQTHTIYIECWIVGGGMPIFHWIIAFFLLENRFFPTIATFLATRLVFNANIWADFYRVPFFVCTDWLFWLPQTNRFRVNIFFFYSFFAIKEFDFIFSANCEPRITRNVEKFY